MIINFDYQTKQARIYYPINLRVTDPLALSSTTERKAAQALGSLVSEEEEGEEEVEETAATRECTVCIHHDMSREGTPRLFEVLDNTCR